MKWYCPYCKKEVEYEVEKRIYEKYKGVKIDVEENIAICKECREELYVNEIEDENNKKIYEKYRAVENIISASDIINFRNKFNISQRELTSILGFGKMTINRYESGSLPNKAQSDYIKAMIDNEELFLNKVNESYDKKIISKRTYEKIKNISGSKKIYNDNKNQSLEKYLVSELSKSPDIYNGFKNFDIEKLKNIISYLASKVDNLYLTSLNKYLWFIDMYSFYKRAIAITGLSYQKEQFGPVICDRKYEEISKLDDKFIREDFEKNDGSYRAKIKSKGNYDLNLLSHKELEIIDEIIEKLKDKTVNQISELSHEENGWKKVDNFNLISFDYANELKVIK